MKRKQRIIELTNQFKGRNSDEEELQKRQGK